MSHLNPKATRKNQKSYTVINMQKVTTGQQLIPQSSSNGVLIIRNLIIIKSIIFTFAVPRKNKYIEKEQKKI